MRWMVSIAIAFVLLGLSVPARAADPVIALIVTDQVVQADSPPFVLSHRLMLPLRATAEALGFRVEFDEAEQAVILTRAGSTAPFATLWLYSDRVVAGGEELVAPFPVLVRSGRSFVAAEFAASLLGVDIRWDGNRQALRINSATRESPQLQGGLVAAAESFCGVNPNPAAEAAQLAHAEIWISSDAPALTAADELRVLRAPAQASPGLLAQACAVAVRRVVYHDPPNSNAPDTAGWLVTYDGVAVYSSGLSTHVNRELQLVLAHDLSPVQGLSYR